MITAIQIEKLFGRFDYQITTKLGGITIITGPNGFGKSTILKIINAVSESNINYFIKLDFACLKISFDNEKKIVIKKIKNGITIDELFFPFLEEEQMEFIQLRRRQPWIRKTATGYIDMRTGEKFFEDEYYYHALLEGDEYIINLLETESRSSILKIKKKLSEIANWCGEVRFISDQRLIRKEVRNSDDTQVIDVISELPKKLKAEISKVSEEYSRVANKLDSSYPKRLFAAKVGLKDKDDYKYCLNEANEKFEKLNGYNLVDMSLIDEKNYNSTYSTALKIYFDDFSQKFTVFQELISKLDLFTKIINDRLTFKKIRITRNNGFEIVDSDTPEKVLQLDQLSSGEKQEIVLFYDLIFNTKSELLLLIDEPELSLHITWQKKFLDDLMEVSKQIQLQVIVATHSPQIVSNYLNIQIDLGEIYGSKLNTQ